MEMLMRRNGLKSSPDTAWRGRNEMQTLWRASDTQEVPLFPVLQTRDMSKISSKREQAEEAVPKTRLSIF